MDLAVNRYVVNDAVLRIAADGEVDLLSCELLAEAIRQAIVADRVAHLMIDLTDVRFIDSCGVQTLVDGERLAKDQGVHYAVVNPSEAIQAVLKETGLIGRY